MALLPLRDMPQNSVMKDVRNYSCISARRFIFRFALSVKVLHMAHSIVLNHGRIKADIHSLKAIFRAGHIPREITASAFCCICCHSIHGNRYLQLEIAKMRLVTTRSSTGAKRHSSHGFTSRTHTLPWCFSGLNTFFFKKVLLICPPSESVSRMSCALTRPPGAVRSISYVLWIKGAALTPKPATRVDMIARKAGLKN